MISEYKIFISVIYCVCLLLSMFFYFWAMKSGDEGTGIWGAAVSFLATLVTGLLLAALVIFGK